MENRIGKFNISQDFIEQNIEEVAEIFTILKFVPMRVESLFVNGTIEMIGYSHMFKEIEKKMCAPEYEINITKKEDGTIEIQVVEV